MNPIESCSFSFCGRDAAQLGLRLTALPARPLPAQKGRSYSVPGRGGSLWLPDDARESVTISVQAETLPSFDPAACAAALAGEGWLVFSDEPDRAYRARCVEAVARESALLRFDRQKLVIPFLCQPWRYHLPEAGDITLSASGGFVQNPGTAPSRPRLRVYGSGDCSATVNGARMEFSAVSGSVVVDSETLDVFAADGLTLANASAVLDEFPTLAPGANAVTWGGGVTRVVVTPRWRDI